MQRWFDNWLRINFKHLTKFTFDEYCPNHLALFDYYLRTYYIRTLQIVLNEPVRIYAAHAAA